jgi:organic hydroperoxide reductase OsmC/OhrA
MLRAARVFAWDAAFFWRFEPRLARVICGLPFALAPGVKMGDYTAEVFWERGEQNFLDNRYSRKHRIRFDGGVEIPASSSPHVVPVPLSDASAVDPEESFVSALASCHMLSFLYVAAKRGFRVDRYEDTGVGIMRKNAEGKLAITVVTLRPKVEFSGELRPARDDIESMHHEAHETCFIASSVKTDVRCEPQW